MIKRTWKMLFLLAVLLVSVQLGAVVARAQDDIVPPDKFLIRNRSNYDIAFFLRRGDGPWVRYGLAAGQDNLYNNADQLWFAPDGYIPIHCRVELGQRYKFVFDGTRWYFLRIVPNQASKLRSVTRVEQVPWGVRQRLGRVRAPPAAAFGGGRPAL